MGFGANRLGHPTTRWRWRMNPSTQGIQGFIFSRWLRRFQSRQLSFFSSFEKRFLQLLLLCLLQLLASGKLLAKRFVLWSSFLLSTLRIDLLCDWQNSTRDPDCCQEYFHFFVAEAAFFFQLQLPEEFCFYGLDVNTRSSILLGHVNEQQPRPTTTAGLSLGRPRFLSIRPRGGIKK